MALFLNFPLFWNFLLMICNFPLLFSHSKNIRMPTLITIIVTYYSLIVIIITKSHNNYCRVGVRELRLLNLLILIDWFLCNSSLVCSFRACHMWLTRNHMFIREIWENLPHSFFEIFKKNYTQISLLNVWILVLITWLSEICLTLLIALFWNFQLMICNFPLLSPHSKNNRMSTLITKIVTYQLLS